MRTWRFVLAGAGVGPIVVGGLLLVQRLSWWQLAWLVVWLAACVVIHDGILLPVLSVARAAWRRAGRGLPSTAIPIVEGGFMVAGALALLVVPEVWAQGRHPANPTILVGDYAGRLLASWAIIALIVLVVVRVQVRRARRGGDEDR